MHYTTAVSLEMSDEPQIIMSLIVVIEVQAVSEQFKKEPQKVSHLSLLLYLSWFKR